MTHKQKFLSAYLGTAMWADSDEEWPEGVDFAPEAREALISEASKWFELHKAAITSAINTTLGMKFLLVTVLV